MLGIAYKFYGPIHLIPVIAFKLKKLKKEPLKVIKQYLMDVLYSCFFIAGYISTFRYLLCFFKNGRGNVMDRWNAILSGFFAGVALFLGKLSIILISNHEKA